MSSDKLLAFSAEPESALTPTNGKLPPLERCFRIVEVSGRGAGVQRGDGVVRWALVRLHPAGQDHVSARLGQRQGDPGISAGPAGRAGAQCRATATGQVQEGKTSGGQGEIGAGAPEWLCQLRRRGGPGAGRGRLADCGGSRRGDRCAGCDRSVAASNHRDPWKYVRAARRAPMPSQLRCQKPAGIGKPVTNEQA
jgi:hypothetical protein